MILMNLFLIKLINLPVLNKHIDDLRLILFLLTQEINVIGISEHNIQKASDKRPANINIPRYHEFLFHPTETTHMVVPVFTSKIILIM